MPRRAVTIELPDDLYERLHRRAAQAQRSIAAEVVELLAMAVPVAEEGQSAELPAELAERLAGMEALNDAALRRAARSHLAARESRRLESLHVKLQAEGLTEAEQQEEQSLLGAYQPAPLIRAHALALLRHRGRDITPLLARR